MLIKVNGFEVEIKAKRDNLDNRFTDKQTKNFANWLSVALDDLAAYYIAKADSTDDTELKECRKSIAHYFIEDSQGIYEQLKNAGFYD